MNKEVIFLAALVSFYSSASFAQSVFGVTADDIGQCATLGDFSEELAKLRDAGRSRQQIAEYIPTGISDDERSDLLNIVFSLQPGEPGFVNKVTGALCVLEKLKSHEVK